MTTETGQFIFVKDSSVDTDGDALPVLSDKDFLDGKAPLVCYQDAINVVSAYVGLSANVRANRDDHWVLKMRISDLNSDRSVQHEWDPRREKSQITAKASPNDQDMIRLGFNGNGEIVIVFDAKKQQLLFPNGKIIYKHNH